MRCIFRRTVWYVLTALLLVSVLTPAYASWRLVMTENFENPANSWTWRQPPLGWRNSQPWVVAPWPMNLTPPHWGIQDYMYRPDVSYPELFRQAAWCDASTIPPGGRDPEFDRYRTNMHTHMRWGPFRTDSITVSVDSVTVRTIRVRDARATFDWVNHTAVRDTFWWEAAWSNGGAPPNPITQRGLWYPALSSRPILDSLGNPIGRDTLVRGYHTGNAMNYWRTGVIKLDSLDSAGTRISLINKPNVWIGFRFVSDGTMDSLIGTVVDNVKVSVDDGLFDFVSTRCSAHRASDTSYVSYPQVGDTLLFKFLYSVRGNQQLRDSTGTPMPVHLRCSINNETIWDSLFVPDAGDDTRNYIAFTRPYIIPIEGTLEVAFNLDADNQVLESSETNNRCSFSFQSITPNYPPHLEFLNFNVSRIDTIYRRYGVPNFIPVIVNVGDQDDTASFYLFNSQDTAAGSGTVLISNRGFPLSEYDRVDTVMWNIGFLTDGEWHVSGVIQDQYNEPVWARALTTVILQPISDAEEQDDIQLPQTTGLAKIYPNPFNSEITLQIGLSKSAKAQLAFFDIMGREVHRVTLADQRPGWYNVSWKPEKLATGVYFVRMLANEEVVSTHKLMYMK